MARRNASEDGFQDQGSLDQPEQKVDGPVNPVLDEHITNPAGTFDTLKALGNQEAVQVDDSSASTLAQVNEARENGEPLTGSLGGGGDQPAVTPAGTGVADAPAAGTADYA